ncbi:nitroreductase/quinone reductase family protein [Blastococcus atacamensis]|uniref:nitroreductase/quinone reductase family protein n=1 Tax=Blastococcus atacamensis TaxID=2070508 RepID=UPI000CECC7F5|nr:nitroreductase/quinone reductase family protein [Blastococcus atacamensis]
MWVRNHLVNPVVRAMARTPGHRLLGGRLLVLAYTGRRTGRRHELPVMSAPFGDGLVVVAGKGEGKTWWRNFGTVPQEVTLRRGGRRSVGAARRLQEGDVGYGAAVEAYRRAFPRVEVAAGTPVILLEAIQSPAPGR